MIPFLLVGHRCTTPDSARKAIRAGANGIEFDIRHYDGTYRVCHDHGLGSPSTPLNQYLVSVNELANEFEYFAALVVDIKDEGMNSARIGEVLNLIRTSVTDETGLITIIDITEFERRDEFSTIIGSLRSNECVCIDGDDSPAKVADYFIARGARNWAYADGTTFETFSRTHDDIQYYVGHAIQMKNIGGLFKIVYAWALKKKKTMRSYLRIGVDGLLVDNVGHLASVLAESEFASKFILAKREDDLFATNYLGRFLGNRHTMEVHDLYALDNNANGCQVDEILFEHQEHFQDIQSALEHGYDGCAKCLKDLSKR
jgi:hypothetical protein